MAGQPPEMPRIPRSDRGTYAFTEAERSEARDLYDLGHGHNEIARHFGWTPPRMAQLTKEEGFDFPSHARRMGETSKARSEARKAAMKEKLLTAIDVYLDRLLEDPYRLVSVTKDGVGVDDVPVPPGFEARDLSTTARQLLACVEKLEEFERARETGTAEVDRFLEAMAGDLDGEEFPPDELPADDSDDPAGV